MRRALLILLALLFGPVLLGPVQAQPVRLDGDSRVWIDGTSTLGPYRCTTDDVRGERDGDGAPARLTIETRSFDCGHRAMNLDFYRALQAERHPALHFTLTDAEPLWRKDDRVSLVVSGRIRIAGASRAVTLRVDARQLAPGRYRAQGRHAMRMSDFGVEPPTGLMGFVRARDAVVIGFDLRGSMALDSAAAASR